MVHYQHLCGVLLYVIGIIISRLKRQKNISICLEGHTFLCNIYNHENIFMKICMLIKFHNMTLYIHIIAFVTLVTLALYKQLYIEAGFEHEDVCGDIKIMSN